MPLVLPAALKRLLKPLCFSLSALTVNLRPWSNRRACWLRMHHSLPTLTCTSHFPPKVWTPQRFLAAMIVFNKNLQPALLRKTFLNKMKKTLLHSWIASLPLTQQTRPCRPLCPSCKHLKLSRLLWLFLLLLQHLLLLLLLSQEPVVQESR
ncbi:hypothetical protein BC830DRAFT_1096273 [Chytriomyces sp. MP71]|nr:hypothetical protein BC830DRAFT_1096273 [Chytriomyces sp. MP71]